MKTLKLNMYSDAGHGWLRIPKKLFNTLDQQLSSYSFYNDSYVYAEEDCDLPRVMNAIEAKGITVIITQVFVKNYSHIRNMDRCNFAVKGNT